MSDADAVRLLSTPTYRSKLQQCVRCGLCLPACPTYQVLGTEMDSPRGRIALMAAAAAGRIPLNGAFEEHISLCLACRACETACPSGVEYGSLVETARIALERERRPSLGERLVRRLVLHHVMPHPRRLRLLATLLALYQRTGLQALIRRLDVLPDSLDTMEHLLPRLQVNRVTYEDVSPAIGPRRGAVAFFHGCVQDAFLNSVNQATVRVLQYNGFDVHVLPGQTCCGAAPLHIGDDTLARRLARRNVDTFAAGTYDAIVNNAGGCGAILKEYDHLLRDELAYAERAAAFTDAVRDVSEFLAERGLVPPRGTVRRRVTYVDSCHLRHAQGVTREPRDVLRAIPGLEVVELQHPDLCCGSAGVYNITQAETATQILDLKLADIADTGADTVVVTNTGCHMQLLYGVQRAGFGTRVVHLVELLHAAYQGEES